VKLPGLGASKSVLRQIFLFTDLSPETGVTFNTSHYSGSFYVSRETIDALICADKAAGRPE